MSYILYLCMVIPMLLILLLLDSDSKRTIFFMILGITVCLAVSELNTLLLVHYENDIYYVTTRITPITEEVLKALPILYFGIVFSDDLKKLLTISMALGVGFAIFENVSLILTNIGSVNYLWAIIRGFGSGLMHGLTTAAIGLGISFVHKRRKFFFPSTFALTSVAIIYHATFNILVQSKYEYIGYFLPIITYIPLAIFSYKMKKRTKMEELL